MANKNLVIVESPAKAKTIEKILGKNYKVVASYGHISDLPKTKLGVDVENNFKPSYNTIKGKGEIIKALKSEAKKSDKIFLASDPDREGEAIAWHISNALKLNKEEKNRIEFNEITEKAIKDAVKHPREIDGNKVNAQQARRILDRLVGYEISPFLWKLISPNTSAGRVQSVALKIICELEEKIKNFKPEKFFEVKADFNFNNLLSLYKVDNDKIDKLKDETILNRIKNMLNENFTVNSAKITKKTKNPPLPLKTSTLQQLSSSMLGFSPSKTMTVAQKLYEGTEIFGKHKGLITYMRTDSVRISDEAKKMADKYIIENFGEKYLFNSKKKVSTKESKIQDAHEAIRPTDINLTPDKIMQFLDKDQFKLYSLIWQRFLISQLASMIYEQFSYILERDKVEFRASISKIIFDGYYKVFKDEEELNFGDFPSIKDGDNYNLKDLKIKEDYTKAPSRLTEAALVKVLESEGIGRPSTYATIIETLKKREYVQISNKSFIPTEIGCEVKNNLEKYFPNIMDIKFTAKLEDELDNVDSGKEDWIDLLSNFYKDLNKYVEKFKKGIMKELERPVISDVVSSSGEFLVMKIGRFGKYLTTNNDDKKENISLRDIDIPLEDIKNGKIFVKKQLEEREQKKEGIKTDVFTDNKKRLILKYGRFGAYLESEDYKNDNVRLGLASEIKKKISDNNYALENDILKINDDIEKIKKEEEKILKSAGKCEKCGMPFKISRGRWGKFLSCTGYPNCKNIKKIK